MHQFECYRVLGLPRNASLDDVKTAYRRLARKYHPDINRDDPTAADKFRLVQEAYQLLKNNDGKNEPTVRTNRSPQPGVKVRTTYHTDRTTNSDRSNHASNSQSRSAQNTTNHTTNTSNRQSPPRSTPPKPPKDPKQTTKERRAQWFANAARRKYRKSGANGAKNKKQSKSGSSASTNNSIDPQVKLKSDTLKRLQDLLRQKKYVVAIAVAEGMREKFPTSLEVIHWQAVAYHRWGSDLLIKGDFKKAELYLNKALTTDPRNRELCFEVKRDLERIGRRQSQDNN
jgi:curved DNA-binding protein CbpA